MPLEIRELHIKATITDDTPSQSTKVSGNGMENKKVIVQECVDKVLEILKSKQDR